MLSYAYKVLNEKSYRKIEVQSFENTLELLTEVLTIGVSKQFKQGLVKDYVDVTESTSSIRGKIKSICHEIFEICDSADDTVPED